MVGILEAPLICSWAGNLVLLQDVIQFCEEVSAPCDAFYLRDVAWVKNAVESDQVERRRRRGQ